MECIHDMNADFILQGKILYYGTCTGLEGKMAQFEELSVAILEKAEEGRRH